MKKEITREDRIKSIRLCLFLLTFDIIIWGLNFILSIFITSILIISSLTLSIALILSLGALAIFSTFTITLVCLLFFIYLYKKL